MKVGDKLAEMYDGYYADDHVKVKREITARQTIQHIKALLGDRRFASAIDIGAGDGAVLAELDASDVAEELHAVEISSSGCEAIRSRSLRRLATVRQFDGYSIDARDDAFGLGLAIHVLEHVEHERVFLAELARVCDLVYVEVPLELTVRTERSIAMSSPVGHINFYTATTFRNLLRTAGLEVVELQVFPNSLDYEVLLAGQMQGRFKYFLRSSLLRAMPSAAPLLMTFMAGALCRRTSSSKSAQ